VITNAGLSAAIWLCVVVAFGDSRELPISASASKRKAPVGAVLNVWSSPPPIE
jgi:hypothetical protein